MTDNVIDLALKKAERLAETLEPIPEEPDEDVIMECHNCQNKAFSILTTKTENCSIPGYDIICTACDSIVTLKGEIVMEEGP